MDSWESTLDLPSGLPGWGKLCAGQELRAAAHADWGKELHIPLSSNSPHIVCTLAPQKAERWAHSGSQWFSKGVEHYTWPQLVLLLSLQVVSGSEKTVPNTQGLRGITVLKGQVLEENFITVESHSIKLYSVWFHIYHEWFLVQTQDWVVNSMD